MTSRSPLQILSHMKKYLGLMSLVHLELENEPLTSKCMVDWLSWKRMFFFNRVTLCLDEVVGVEDRGKSLVGANQF